MEMRDHCMAGFVVRDSCSLVDGNLGPWHLVILPEVRLQKGESVTCYDASSGEDHLPHPVSRGPAARSSAERHSHWFRREGDYHEVTLVQSKRLSRRTTLPFERVTMWAMRARVRFSKAFSKMRRSISTGGKRSVTRLNRWAFRTISRCKQSNFVVHAVPSHSV